MMKKYIKKISILFLLLLMVSVLYADQNIDLIRAVKNGDKETAESLLEKGADIDSADYVYRWTALHWAVYTDQADMVRFLLEKGADYKLKSQAGRNAYELAQLRDNQEMIQLFQELAIVDVDENIPQGSGFFGRDTLAIIIGNQDYEHGIPDVEFAFNDAEIMKKYLNQTFGVDDSQVKIYRNLTKANFEQLFGTDSDFTRSRLYRDINIGSYDVFIYYSGHGAPSTMNLKSGKGYLVPVDAEISSVDMTGYPVDTLLNNLKKMKDDGVINRLWVVFDACFSGDSGGGMLLQDVSPVGITVSNPMVGSDETVLMYSSQGNEVSSWYRSKRHGMFTYFLLKSFNGEADVDGNRKLTVAEVENYVRDKVSRYALKETGHSQNPNIITEDESLELLELK